MHYANLPIQYMYTANFHGCKNGNLQMKKTVIFLAHLSRQLRHPSPSLSSTMFKTSPLKPLCQSEPNFMWIEPP